MIVLGLHGWPSRSHDACACLLVDGQVRVCAEEERFVRQRYAYDHAPHRAARWCLDAMDLQMDDVDAVAYGWAADTMSQSLNSQRALDTLLPRRLFPRTRSPHFVFVPHHIAHAASAFYPSGFDSAAVLVVDGQGEDASVTIGWGRNGRIVVLEQMPVAMSLGYFYEAACLYVGLRTHDAGKLMGLAAHGLSHDNWLTALHVCEEGYEVHLPLPPIGQEGTDQQAAILDMWLRHLEDTLPLAQNTGGRNVFDYRDLAATAQVRLETAISALVRRACKSSGEDRIVLAGGVALNAKSNGLLYKLFGADRMFVQPLANDAGTALGAAMYVAAELGDRVSPLDHRLALGPEYSPSQIARALDEFGLAFCETSEPHKYAAELIGRGAVIGWFQGRAEIGPRALGQRSILAPVSDVRSRDRVNLRVKNREWWRPLAPSMLRDESKDYLGIDEPFHHMVISSSVTGVGENVLAAAVHVDGTTRPQTVERGSSPYSQLLEAIQHTTGHSAVLNTSFNGPGEPIVHTPQDACGTYLRRPLNALIIGNFVTEAVGHD